METPVPEKPNNPSDIAEAILSELDHFQQHFVPEGGDLTFAGQYHLASEPCVGYAFTQRYDRTIVELFICRNYVPFGYTPSRTTIDYASYLSPLGRIIAKKPGDMHEFFVGEGTFSQDVYKLHSKNEFRLKKQDGCWDATENKIEWIGGGVLVR